MISFFLGNYKDCYTSSQKSCSLTLEIGTKNEANMDLSKCIHFCNQKADCKFIQFVKWHTLKDGSNKMACIRYRSCGLSRESDHIGTTYSKDGTCSGIQRNITRLRNLR